MLNKTDFIFITLIYDYYKNLIIDLFFFQILLYNVDAVIL